jgi:uroporphyrinogen decarboxylase
MLAAFHYQSPDKIPVVYHPSPAGLYVHGKQLLDLFRAYPPDNPITFDAIPHPPEGSIDAGGRYHELRVDEWGTMWEYLIFGIQGHPKEYALDQWSAGQTLRFPPVPRPGSRLFEEESARVGGWNREFLSFMGWISIFERLHALRPIDEVLMDLAVEDVDLLKFLDRLVAYWLELINYYLDIGVDVIQFGDDWGTQTGQLVSTSLFRRIFLPRYRILMDPIRKAGKKIFFHSCGNLGEILPEILGLRVDGIWPQLSVYDDDYLSGLCRKHRIAMYIHPDRQRLVPLGSPEDIRRRIRDYAERHRSMQGGGIFYIEMENDAPFENVKALIESVHAYR